jgi:hypothetical protein
VGGGIYQFHPWVIEDLPNPEQWIRDTEPSGYHDDDFEGEEVVADHVQVSFHMHVLSMVLTPILY